jgi:hypothetical protein
LTDPKPASSAAGPAPARKRRWILWLALVGIALLLLPIGWTSLTLSWSYSDGERAGILQKLSNKGWVCKTSEGELAMYLVKGMQPQIWAFSVRDPKVIEAMKAAVGKQVLVHYSEHKGVPSSCFGETPYFVDSVKVVGEGPVNP